MTYIERENLMRGKEARRANVAQLIAFDTTSKYIASAGIAFSIYLAFVVDTAPSHIAARAVLTGAICALFNGMFLLHRKWDENVMLEQKSQNGGGVTNPSLNVGRVNKFFVGFTRLPRLRTPVSGRDGLQLCSIPAGLVVSHLPSQVYGRMCSFDTAPSLPLKFSATCF